MLSLETFQYYTTNLWAKITDKFMTKDEAVNGVLLDPQWELVETVQNNNTITLPQLDTFDELYIVMDNGESTVIHQTDIKKESLVTENENVTYREILLDTLYDAETYATYYPETNTIVPSVCEGVTIDETTSITTTVYVKKYNGVDFSNLSATLVSYDDSISGLDAINVQGAIQQLDRKIDNIPSGENGKDGADGKSAYQYAQDSGYTGTEEEFSILLASIGDINTLLDIINGEVV